MKREVDRSGHPWAVQICLYDTEAVFKTQQKENARGMRDWNGKRGQTDLIRHGTKTMI